VSSQLLKRDLGSHPMKTRDVINSDMPSKSSINLKERTINTAGSLLRETPISGRKQEFKVYSETNTKKNLF